MERSASYVGVISGVILSLGLLFAKPSEVALAQTDGSAASQPTAARSPSAAEEATPQPSQRSAINPTQEELDAEVIDLGEPLVDNPGELRRLDPNRPLWIDAKNKQVVMIGEVCQQAAPLEVFACLRYTKEHEAVVTLPVKAFAVHSGLLALGAKPGGPAQFHPEYKPASGDEIEITVKWKDKEGNVQSARAQDWVRNTATKKAMEQEWVFAGSGFWQDELTGQRRYMAEGGDFICVSNFPGALLDIPVRSTDVNDELMFEAFTERVPPRGTRVTVILTPKKKQEAAPKPETEAK